MRRLLVAGLAVTGALATAAAVPLAAYRFALAYRTKAGFPARRPALQDPSDFGLQFRTVAVPGPAGQLPAWFVPAPLEAAAPGIVLVHGWESNRARMLPNAAFLHAVGFSTLAFDVRGHGENPPECLPVTAAEFGRDASAAVTVLAAMPGVTAVGLLGHSIGGVGAALAAAADPRVGALVTTSTPADARRLTRRTFQLAGLHVPGPVALPLAWLTTRVFLRPRGHAPADVSASRAVGRYGGPVLVVHGTEDEVVPAGHAELLVAAARARDGRARAVRAGGARAATSTAGPLAAPSVEVLMVEGGHHRWLYEDAGYRATVARFLTEHLGGPLSPAEAAARAASIVVSRPPDTAGPFSALERERRPAPDAPATVDHGEVNPAVSPPAHPTPPRR